jgi:hypothetical protein
MVEHSRVFKTSETDIGHRFSSISPDGKYIRTLIHTGFIAPRQSPATLLNSFIPDLEDFPGEDKVVCLGSKVVALLQNRVRREDEIHPGILCQVASKFGTRTEHGVGVAGYPKKIQAAIDEVGLNRIIFALAASGLEKIALKLNILKDRIGIFFIVAGDKVKAIDGLSPGGGYEHHILLCPDNAEFLASLSGNVKFPVALVDINYVGGDVPVTTPNSPLSKDEIYTALKDNPFGQFKERTPLAVIGRI